MGDLSLTREGGCHMVWRKNRVEIANSRTNGILLAPGGDRWGIFPFGMFNLEAVQSLDHG